MGAYTRADRAAVRDETAAIHALFPVLAERARLPAGTLSGGEQMMLAIGRALLGRPRLLLLDEPSLGLAPRAVETIFEVIAGLDRPRRHHPADRAERRDGAGDRRPRLRDGERPHRARGHRRASLAADDRVRRAYLGATRMSQYLFQQLVNGLALGSLYALVAIGFSMIYGIVRLINFAHGDLVMIGAFATLGLAAGRRALAADPAASCWRSGRLRRHDDRDRGVPPDPRRAAGDRLHRHARGLGHHPEHGADAADRPAAQLPVPAPPCAPASASAGSAPP